MKKSRKKTTIGVTRQRLAGKLFSQNVLRYLDQNDQSQLDLANALKVNKSTVYRWIADQRVPAGEYLGPIAHALGVRISSLFTP